MLFSARNLRYHIEDCYSSFCSFLQRRAKFYLRQLGHDSMEVDEVVAHIIEQLTRLGLIGARDDQPPTLLEQLTDAQFLAFLNRSIKNKAIDRLRKKRLPVSLAAGIETYGEVEEEKDPFEDRVETVWSKPPFATPEEAALEAVKNTFLLVLLKECIRLLGNAPHQLLALEQEFEELGVEELVQFMHQEFDAQLTNVEADHMSQHKDHAHKKLRLCLQGSSNNLRVLVALRLSQYGQHATKTGERSVPIKQLMTDTQGKQDLSDQEVKRALGYLVSRGLLNWQGEEIVRFSFAQAKRLARYYEKEDEQ
jgi:DNA-directed RNA polymerase specialized sigma24 family protein